MKKLSKNIFVIGLAALALTSCSDIADEITELVLDRNLAPVGLDSKGVSTTGARLEWTASEKATAYIVEVFADDSLTFAGSPVQTLTAETNEITLSNLVYDTKYSARVSAITEGDDARASKWSEIFFRTSAQQFMKSFKEENIADRSLTVMWDTDETGSDVTTIKALDESGKVVATKTLTADEIAAGSAVIDGLTPETKYTIKLYNGEKERGSRSVTTIADLAGAVLVHADDDLAQMVKDADENAVLALYGGTYEVSPNDEGKMTALKVTKNLTIKGIYPTNRPVIKGRFQIDEGAALSLSQLVINGAETSGDQIFTYKTAGVTYGPLNVQDCEIIGQLDVEGTTNTPTKGLLYGNETAVIESITFNNCLIHDIECNGGDFFDLRKAYVPQIKFTNSTIYNCAMKRDLFRYDDSASNHENVKAPEITVDHCTFYNIQTGTSGKRILYIRFNGKNVGQVITWTNNLIVSTKALYSNQSTTSLPTFADNYYFGCDNASLFAADALDTDPKVYTRGDVSGKNGEDPKFKNAASGDFTIGNETVSKLGVGDPRWLSAGE